ncbi:MAG: rRNA maturation RNase YbeY [Bacteroidetes bacterium]|nr:rRNA maturation RNase YbeY [Bacteroidota bacterium]
MRQVPQVSFITRQSPFRIPHKNRVRTWLSKVIQMEKYTLKELNIILIDNKGITKLNKKYLNHSYPTDIITFDNSDKRKEIEGDIFVGIEVVKENAKLYKVLIFNELCRIIVHGVLHLMNYNDKSRRQQLRIRAKEEYYLRMFK